MLINQRKFLILFLIISLFFQSSLVYFDSTGNHFKPLTKNAKIGKKIWMKKNCQSCHQIHGFGGFIGPDLTNSINYLTNEQINKILTFGSKQMPNFNFSNNQKKYIISYLRYLNETGVSIPKFKNKTFMILKKINKKLSSNQQLRLGFKLIVQKQCFSCHARGEQSTLKAPDLINSINKLTKNEIFNILKNGKIFKGMPAFKFSNKQRSNIYKLLQWMSENKKKIYYKDNLELKMLKNLPWFEYE